MFYSAPSLRVGFRRGRQGHPVAHGGAQYPLELRHSLLGVLGRHVLRCARVGFSPERGLYLLLVNDGLGQDQVLERLAQLAQLQLLLHGVLLWGSSLQILVHPLLHHPHPVKDGVEPVSEPIKIPHRSLVLGLDPEMLLFDPVEVGLEIGDVGDVPVGLELVVSSQRGDFLFVHGLLGLHAHPQAADLVEEHVLLLVVLALAVGSYYFHQIILQSSDPHHVLLPLLHNHPLFLLQQAGEPLHFLGLFLQLIVHLVFELDGLLQLGLDVFEKYHPLIEVLWHVLHPPQSAVLLA